MKKTIAVMLGASACSVALVIWFVSHLYTDHILGRGSYDIDLPSGNGIHYSYDFDLSFRYLKLTKEGELKVHVSESGLYTQDFNLSELLSETKETNGILILAIDKRVPFREYHSLHESIIGAEIEFYVLSLSQLYDGTELIIALKDTESDSVSSIDLLGDGSLYWTDSKKGSPHEVNGLHEITAISSKYAHRNGSVEIYVDPECDYQKFINLLDHLLLGDARITSINILTSQRWQRLWRATL